MAGRKGLGRGGRGEGRGGEGRRGGKYAEGRKEGREEKKTPWNKFLKSKGNSHHK